MAEDTTPQTADEPGEEFAAFAEESLELAELATDPGDLLERMIEAAKPAFAGRPPSADGVFALDSTRNPWTALKDALTAALSVRWEHATHLAARLAEAERRAEHFEGELASVRDHNTRWELERARANDYRNQRDEAYRTLEIHRTRAEQAERELKAYDTLRQRNLDRAITAEAQVAALREELDLQRAIAKTGDGWQSRAEQAERELTEARSMIDDTLWRMHQLRSWAYRETSGDVQHNVLSVITNVWDCLDPGRTRNPSLWCEGTSPDDPEEIRRLAESEA